MTGNRYVKLPGSRRVSFSAGAEQPARYYAESLASVLNHGMPARRRGGPVLAALGRRELPTGVVARALRARRPEPDAGLDAVLRLLRAEWQRIAPRSPHVPDQAPARMSLLQVERSAAQTVFVFAEDPFPLLVMKHPHENHLGARREATALETAEPARVSPRYLGTIGDFHVQEGLRGLPLRVTPVRPATAASLPWTPDFDQLTEALQRLGRTTAHPGRPAGLIESIERAAAQAGSPQVTRRVKETASRLADLDVRVLQHADMSAQNWLVHESAFIGLVDWELAVVGGVPGFDMMQAAMSLFEHGIGLTKWSDDIAVRSFRASWTSSPFFRRARRSLRLVAEESGVGADMAQALEIGYFARRAGGTTRQRRRHQISSEAMGQMLETVCSE